MVEKSNFSSQAVTDDLGFDWLPRPSSRIRTQDSGAAAGWNSLWSESWSRPLSIHDHMGSAWEEVPSVRGSSGDIGDFRVISAFPDPPAHREALVIVQDSEDFRMDLLPLLSELARHAAESLGHDVRAEARTVYQEDAREVFVEIRTATASTSQTLIELEDELTFWLLETYPEVGREVTVYLKRA